MYKHFFTFIVLIIATMISAQTTYDTTYSLNQPTKQEAIPDIAVGLKISPSINWIDVVNTDAHAEGASLKFSGGGVICYKVLPNISLVSGINYSSFGGYVSDSKSVLNNRNANFSVNYSEIEVPLEIKLKTNKTNKTDFFLQGGVTVGFLVNAAEKSYPLVANASPNYFQINSLTNKLRLGYTVGTGIDYSIGKRTSLFGLICYKSTLTNVAKSNEYMSEGRYLTPLQLYPGCMEFSVGIMF